MAEQTSLPPIIHTPKRPVDKTALPRTLGALFLIPFGLLLLAIYGASLATLAISGANDNFGQAEYYSLTANGSSFSMNASPGSGIDWRPVVTVIGIAGATGCAVGLALAFRQYSLGTALIVVMLIGLVGALPFMALTPPGTSVQFTVGVTRPPLADEDLDALRRTFTDDGLKDLLGPKVLDALRDGKDSPFRDVTLFVENDKDGCSILLKCPIRRDLPDDLRSATQDIVRESLLDRTGSARAGMGPPSATSRVSAGHSSDSPAAEKALRLWLERRDELDMAPAVQQR